MHNEIFDGNEQEPNHVRGLSKNAIYKMLLTRWFLPDKNARGVTRSYLINVDQAQVFRIERQTILEWEARLTADEMIKASFLSLPTCVEKINHHLQQLQHRTLGFTRLNYPDESWLLRIIRYVDPFNLVGAFRRRIQGAPCPNTPAGRM
jgi:hypothetical protein